MGVEGGGLWDRSEWSERVCTRADDMHKLHPTVASRRTLATSAASPKYAPSLRMTAMLASLPEVHLTWE